MARGPQTPKRWAVVERIEAYEEVLIEHGRDGVISLDEWQFQVALLRGDVKPVAVDAADCGDIAQAVERYGPECGHAQRLLRDRERRLADARRFGGSDDGPDGPATGRMAA